MYRLAAQDGENLERKENHVMTDTKNKESQYIIGCLASSGGSAYNIDQKSQTTFSMTTGFLSHVPNFGVVRPSILHELAQV